MSPWVKKLLPMTQAALTTTNWMNSAFQGETDSAWRRGNSRRQKNRMKLGSSMATDPSTAHSATGDIVVAGQPTSTRITAASRLIKASRLNQPSPWQSAEAYELHRFPNTQTSAISVSARRGMLKKSPSGLIKRIAATVRPP